jgi:N-acetylglucosaminyldiphosphoundecaprenol N-acetyl-beta-D-mannosaminyltransferase
MAFANIEPSRAIPFRLKRRTEERIEILGAAVDLVRPEEMLLFVSRKVSARQSCMVATHNLRSLSLMGKSAELRNLYRRADIIQVGSAPVIAWGRLLARPIRAFHRCSYSDWRGAFWATAARESWRVFYLGGEPGAAELGKRVVQRSWPQVKIGVHDGAFHMNPGGIEAKAVLKQVQDFKPDVLIVGMGMPEQAIWINRHADQLPGCAIVSAVGAFDHEARLQGVAPRRSLMSELQRLGGRLSHPASFARSRLRVLTGIFRAVLDDLRTALAPWRSQP